MVIQTGTIQNLGIFAIRSLNTVQKKAILVFLHNS